MNKFVIEYHDIKSDHILATPEYTRSEFVEADSIGDVIQYVQKHKKDGYGHNFSQTGNKKKHSDLI